MPDEAAAGLEESLLQARQRPALDGTGEVESWQKVPEVVRDASQEQPRLVGPETVAGKPRPLGGGFALT
jgi:hypothetical protein